MNNLEHRHASLISLLERECIAMFEYALNNGLNVSPDLARALEQFKPDHPGTDEISEKDRQDLNMKISERAGVLTTIHNELSETVKPVKPKTILSMIKIEEIL